MTRQVWPHLFTAYIGSSQVFQGHEGLPKILWAFAVVSYQQSFHSKSMRPPCYPRPTETSFALSKQSYHTPVPPFRCYFMGRAVQPVPTIYSGPRTKWIERRIMVTHNRTTHTLIPAFPDSGLEVIHLDCDINKVYEFSHVHGYPL